MFMKNGSRNASYIKWSAANDFRCAPLLVTFYESQSSEEISTRCPGQTPEDEISFEYANKRRLVISQGRLQC